MKKILIIDDNNIITHLWKTKLSGNFEVFIAGNGKEGLKKAAEVKPDVIILEIMIEEAPQMTGIDLARELKKNSGLKDTPIVFTYNTPLPDLIKEAYELGVKHSLQKNKINPEFLIGLLNDIIANNN